MGLHKCLYKCLYKYSKYSRTPTTRTLKGNEKQFELARVRVIGVDWKIQYAMLEIDVYWFLSTSLYGAGQI